LQLTIRGIVPHDGIVDTKKLDKAVKRVLRNAAKRMKRGLAGPTEDWEHKVVFRSHTGVVGDDAFVQVYTEDEIYGYVNDGVPARDIYPRADNPRGYLSYQQEFAPKTKPGSLEPTGGQGKFGAWFHPSWSPWTGVEARHFDEVVSENEEEQILSDIEDAIDMATA